MNKFFKKILGIKKYDNIIKKEGFLQKYKILNKKIKNKIDLEKELEGVKTYMKKMSTRAERLANINKDAMLSWIINDEPIWIKKVKKEIQENDIM